MTEIRQTIKAIGEPALATLDGIDVEQQSRCEPDLNEVVVCLVRLRDELIRRYRGGEDCGTWLTRVNAMLSEVFGVEYPAGGIPWRRIQDTRDDLRDLLDSL